MKFRALNLDYHAEATFHLWEQREKEPRVIIRLLGPEEIAPAVSNKDDGDKPIVSNDPALYSLKHIKDGSSTIDSSMIEEPEMVIDIMESAESNKVSR